MPVEGRPTFLPDGRSVGLVDARTVLGFPAASVTANLNVIKTPLTIFVCASTPADQLHDAMTYMAATMGGNCSTCHPTP